MLRALPRWLPLAVLTAAALWIRTADLGARPMHSDEANQAVKAGELLETGHYAFDPADHHGPVLYYAVLPLAWARGQHSLAELDETTVRLVPAIAGAACVLLIGLLASPLGRRVSLTAAALAAVSPPAVYYSRYFIQETPLLAFSLGFFWSASGWHRNGGALRACAAGVFAGLMLASKESAPLFMAASLAALLAAGFPRGAPEAGRPAVEVLLGAAAALFVAATLYSSFGRHLEGLRDALSAYRFSAGRLASGATGQEKPWGYYLSLLGWHRSGGLLFQEIAPGALAVAGLFAAYRSRAPLLRWAAAYAAIVLVAMSATPYKTPWNVIHLMPAVSILASAGLGAACSSARGRLVSSVVALAVLALMARETRRVASTYASDERNPFAYVHTSPDMLKVRGLALSARERGPGLPIKVVSEEYWPIPWYFRGIPAVGYWSSPPPDCDGCLVLASADLARGVESRLHGSYGRTYLGLRPGFVLVAFTRAP